MWKYIQATGQMLQPDGTLLAIGYSGRDQYKNDQQSQCDIDLGPIPRGTYTIALGITHHRLGPIAMRLIPDTGNQMCGRSGFYIHGDSRSHPGQASDGCIILNVQARTTMDESADRRLLVVDQPAE